MYGFDGIDRVIYDFSREDYKHIPPYATDDSLSFSNIGYCAWTEMERIICLALKKSSLMESS